MNWSLILTAVLSCVVSLFSTYAVRWAARTFHWLDKPGRHKSHSNPIPLLGGIAIYLAFLIPALFLNSKTILQEGSAILIGATLLTLTGLYDDLRGLQPTPKLIVQSLATLSLVLGGIHIQLFNLYWLDIAVTLLWVVGICNALNLLDNMDGLSAGITAIACLFFTVLAVSQGQILVSILAATLLGATLGFLCFNWHPATIFMGDAGSLLLGFMLAAVAIKLRFPLNTLDHTWMVPIFVLAIPIFDTTLVTISRIRRGISITEGGRDHTSHRLKKLGLTIRQTVTTIYVAAFLCGLAAVTAALVPNTLLVYSMAAVLVIIGILAIFVLEQVDLSDSGQPKGRRSSSLG